jgi:hypothetical protein
VKKGWKIVTPDDSRGWRRAARNWKGWLRQHHLDDDPVVERPTERQALHRTEAQAFAGDTIYALPLTAFEMDIYGLERLFMSQYRTGEFMKRWGILSPGQKYAWIAAQRPGLSIWDVRTMLDDIYYALNSYYFDVAVRNIRSLYVMPELTE